MRVRNALQFPRSLLSRLCLVARVLFLNSCSFPAELAKVVKFRTPHLTSAHNIDVIDNGRVQRENSLDADAETDLPHRDRFARPAMFASYNYTLEDLQTLLIAFLDADV